MYASIVFRNGEIWTMNQDNDVVEAVAIKDNKIIAVGSYDEVKHYVHNETDIIDLKGKTMLPGFIDAHLHLMIYGAFQRDVDFKKQQASSIDDVLRLLTERAAQTPKGEWIRAVAFDELALQEQRNPTLAELDSVTSEHPIIITRTPGHIGFTNSMGFARAGITKDTPDPKGGIYEKDAEGNLTGKLIESVYMRFNETAKLTEHELYEAITIAQEHFLKHGITSVHDAGTYDGDSYRVLQLASQQKKLKIRVYAMIGSLNDCYTFTTNMMQAGVVTGTGNAFFKVGPAKLFTDGSSTGPTIATREGYTSNSKYKGMLIYTEDEVYEVLGKAHAKGYQITVHAQGDQAIELYLNVVERALQEHPRENHRHRIEHAGIAPKDLQHRMKTLGVIPIINPPFPAQAGDIYQQHYGERTNDMYAAKDLLQLGTMCAASSDAPVASCNPMIGIHAAVNRQTESGKDFGVKQKVSVMDAVRMYTYNAAYASFDEQIKGSIEVGKLADIIVLTETLSQVPHKQLQNVKVQLTMIDGEILYQHASY